MCNIGYAWWQLCIFWSIFQKWFQFLSFALSWKHSRWFHLRSSTVWENITSRLDSHAEKDRKNVKKVKWRLWKGCVVEFYWKKSKLITRTREVIQSLSSDGICGSSIKTIWRTCQRLSGQQDVDLTAFKCHEIIAHLIIFDQLNIFFLLKSW